MSGEDPNSAAGSTEPAGQSESLRALPTAREELARLDSQPSPLYDFGPDHKRRFHEATVKRFEIRARQADDDRDLRKDIAERVFKAITAQVAIADVVFAIYGFWNGWSIPGAAIEAWLGAVVAQVIAVGLVIAR